MEMPDELVVGRPEVENLSMRSAANGYLRSVRERSDRSRCHQVGSTPSLSNQLHYAIIGRSVNVDRFVKAPSCAFVAFPASVAVGL